MAQWLGVHASTAGHMDSIPDQGTKILHAIRCGKKTKQKSNHLSFACSLTTWQSRQDVQSKGLKTTFQTISQTSV